ncbi:hypothetical protein N5923_12315 [Erwiniaceae bacterium BAC15a-03b]|uniref:Secreted protein n=1 Tax=Winslowiella arboricola TaxID=2978220 RepID=A0A9J6PU43_9GAMM|nr:hypothetical protein [Winslowiella arboricola]MCU5772726.1 hypothetical protein [Winslowiella arboricola]MCU5778276.1 hypothetical protein [Winslowiella arboricola]
MKVKFILLLLVSTISSLSFAHEGHDESENTELHVFHTAEGQQPENSDDEQSQADAAHNCDGAGSADEQQESLD